MLFLTVSATLNKCCSQLTPGFSFFKVTCNICLENIGNIVIVNQIEPVENSNAKEYLKPDEPLQAAPPSAASYKLLHRGAVDANDLLPVEKDKLVTPSAIQDENLLCRTLIATSNLSIHNNANSRSTVYEIPEVVDIMVHCNNNIDSLLTMFPRLQNARVPLRIKQRKMLLLKNVNV